MNFLLTNLPLLIIYFLPGSSITLIIIFELLTRIPNLKTVYLFIQGPKLFVLFFLLLAIEWIIKWKVDPMNDLVFLSQLVTGIIPSFMTYNWLGKKWKILSLRGSN